MQKKTSHFEIFFIFMSFVGKSSRRKLRYDDINDSSLSKHEKILSEEVYYQKQIKKLNNKKDKSVVENDDKRIKRKELTLVDIIERLILGKITFLFLIP